MMRFESGSGPKKPSVQLKKYQIYLDLNIIMFLANIVIQNISDLKGLVTRRKDFAEVK